MKTQTLHELYIGNHPISILQSEEGEIFAHFENPTPEEKTQERILSYLKAEGFFPQEETPKDYGHGHEVRSRLTPKIIVTLQNGTKETFQLHHSEILAYDSSIGEITIVSFGKIQTLNHVKSVETQEE